MQGLQVYLILKKVYQIKSVQLQTFVRKMGLFCLIFLSMKQKRELK